MGSGVLSAETVSMPDSLGGFTFRELFPNLPQIASNVRNWVFLPMAFIIIVSVIYEKSNVSKSHDETKTLVGALGIPVMLAGLCIATPTLTNMVIKTGDDSASAFNLPNTYQQASRIMNVFDAAGSLDDPAFGAEVGINRLITAGGLSEEDFARVKSNLHGYGDRLRNPIINRINNQLDVISAELPVQRGRYGNAAFVSGLRSDLVDYLEEKGLLEGDGWMPSVGDSVQGVMQDMQRTLMGWTLSVISYITAFVLVIAETIRGMLLHTGSSLMPVFVAGLGTSWFRSNSMSYIFGYVSIAFWPVAWGLANIGTAAMYDYIFRAISGPLSLTAEQTNALLSSDDPANMQEIRRTLAEGMQLIGVTGQAYVAILLFMASVWAIGMTVIAPKLLTGVITRGADFFSGMAASTGAITRGTSQVANMPSVAMGKAGNMARSVSTTAASMRASTGSAKNLINGLRLTSVRNSANAAVNRVKES